MDVWIKFNKFISKIIATLNELRCCMRTTQIQQIINDQQNASLHAPQQNIISYAIMYEYYM